MESIILSSGTEVTPEDIQKIASAVNDLLLTTSKDPGSTRRPIACKVYRPCRCSGNPARPMISCVWPYPC